MTTFCNLWQHAHSVLWHLKTFEDWTFSEALLSPRGSVWVIIRCQDGYLSTQGVSRSGCHTHVARAMGPPKAPKLLLLMIFLWTLKFSKNVTFLKNLPSPLGWVWVIICCQSRHLSTDGDPHGARWAHAA